MIAFVARRPPWQPLPGLGVKSPSNYHERKAVYISESGLLQDILCYSKRVKHLRHPFRINFKHFSFYISSRTKPASNKKRMTGYIKKPHTAIFIGQTGCGKTHLVLDLIENQYNNHFDYIVIICPTLRENNETYLAKDWIKNDDKV